MRWRRATGKRAWRTRRGKTKENGRRGGVSFAQSWRNRIRISNGDSVSACGNLPTVSSSRNSIYTIEETMMVLRPPCPSSNPSTYCGLLYRPDEPQKERKLPLLVYMRRRYSGRVKIIDFRSEESRSPDHPATSQGR